MLLIVRINITHRTTGGTARSQHQNGKNTNAAHPPITVHEKLHDLVTIRPFLKRQTLYNLSGTAPHELLGRCSTSETLTPSRPRPSLPPAPPPPTSTTPAEAPLLAQPGTAPRPRPSCSPAPPPTSYPPYPRYLSELVAHLPSLDTTPPAKDPHPMSSADAQIFLPRGLYVINPT